MFSIEFDLPNREKFNFRMNDNKGSIRGWTGCILKSKLSMYYRISGPVNNKILTFLHKLYRDGLSVPVTMKLRNKSFYIKRSIISDKPRTWTYSELHEKSTYHIDDICCSRYFQKGDLFCETSILCFGIIKEI